MERAFAAPAELQDRLCAPIDAATVAAYDADLLVGLFSTPPALHRYPKAMAERVQALCAAIVKDYDGDVERIWDEAADGRDVVARLQGLPGFGKQKAQIFTALLGKQCGVTPDGWREAAGSYGDADSRRSIADVIDPETLAEVREFKQAQKKAAKEQSPTS